jgi:hypothetical protein
VALGLPGLDLPRERERRDRLAREGQRDADEVGVERAQARHEALGRPLDVRVLALVGQRRDDVRAALDAAPHHEAVRGQPRRRVLGREEAQRLLHRASGPEILLVVVEALGRAQHGLGLVDARRDLVADEVDLGEELVALHLGEAELGTPLERRQPLAGAHALERARSRGPERKSS